MSRRALLAGFVAPLLLLGGVAAYRGLALPRDRDRTRRPAREITVRVAEARRGPVRHVLSTTGDVLPLLQADLTPKVSGTVAAVEVEIGQAVAAGQVIARLEQAEAFRNLALALLLAVALIYMVLASQYRSLLHPFIIMFSVPLGVIGVIWALLLTGTTLSVISLIGVIMMVGIVVSNAILLVDTVNLRRREGIPLHAAIV